MGWGGLRRPISVSRLIRRFALTWTAVWLFASASGVAAHGGVPTIQLDVQRINPGATIEVLADMTSQGSYEVLLVAPANARTWSLGTFEADYEGHVRTFLVIPPEISTGPYRITARNDLEEASAPLEVTGTPSNGEAGRLPGQDEARAPVVADPGGSSASPDSPTGATTAPTDSASNLTLGGLVVLLAVGTAFVIGRLIGSRRRPTATP